MNDAWLAVLLAFGVTFAVMSAVNRWILHFSMATSILFALIWAAVVAATTFWRERH